MPKGLKVENDECVKEIIGTKSVKLRLLLDCDVVKEARKQLRVKLALEGANNQLFWNQMHLPSVWVSLEPLI